MSWLCFDIGGTFVKYGLYTDQGKLEEKGKFATEINSANLFIDSLVNQAEKMDAAGSIKGIGLSFPGFINPVTGEAVLAGALTALHGKNVIEMLKFKLQKKYLFVIENDANCAALAEKFNGNAIKCKDFVLITIGTGIGGAIVIDGVVVHGRSFRTGELGMMITDFHRSSYKTLHDLASTSALVTNYKLVKKIPASQIISGEQVFSEMADQQIYHLIKEWACFVAIGIFNTVVSLNPEKVLIGGGVSQNPELLPVIKECLAENPHWQDFEVPIETCQHFNDSGLIGALYLLMEQAKAAKSQ